VWTRPALTLLAFAALNMLLAVAAGAFGAHVLETRLDAHHLTIFETAARYHVYHALGMALCAVLARDLPRAQLSGWLFQSGIVLFSGSLYALALSGVKLLGAITPLGGLLLILGWAALALTALRARPQ
jgi:uncharacterized membrane protein YgdD (TMEM256/DUF423 family)